MSPVSSASGMNSPGGTRPAFGMLPAHERLGTDAARILEPHDRLEEQAQLAALDRAVQRVLGRVPRERALANRVVEDDDASAARFLRVIHRGVGVAQQLVGRFFTGRR